MPFIPHTQADIETMLATIGINNINELFDEVPQTLVNAELEKIPEGLNENRIARLMQDRMPEIKAGTNFIGAGAYEHYIPAAVWQLVSRGEFYTAYTPYQAEASQGSLQTIYEYQTMMAELMQMDVSNASLYDGATALCEAVLMVVRLKKSRAMKILLPKNINPAYRKVLHTILPQQGIELREIEFVFESGKINLSAVNQSELSEAAAVIISQPNFFGTLEDQDELVDWAHANKLLVIASVNPLAMALLKPPGKWGKQGADIVCGEGQPLGVPLSYGGPYFGFMCCRQEFVRQMPGRIVGKTKDKAGNVGYVLTLQAREQHIRRAKATSNICTNQGLLVVAATLYLSLLGAKGLRETALQCHHSAQYLANKIARIPGVALKIVSPFWHEFVISLPKPIAEIQALMREKGIEAGFDLGAVYPNFTNCMLVCTTETKTHADLDHYARVLQSVVIKLLTRK